MDNIAELQDLVKNQLERHKVSKIRAPLSSTLPTTKRNKLTFGDINDGSSQDGSSITSQQLNPVLLEFDPFKEYQRSNRLIKHSNDKYIIDADYPDHLSFSSSTGGRKKTKGKGKFPSNLSLSSSTNSTQWKSTTAGRLRKVTLAKLDNLPGCAELNHSQLRINTNPFDSENTSISSLQSQSVHELFSTAFMEREETTKKLDEERSFTSKVITPRLIKHDTNAQFKSKDILNGLIEDITMMSVSSLGTKGQSIDSGSMGTLKEWKSMYETEKVNYDSAALYAEVRYLELKAKERSEGMQPTKLKATVCADLLLKLCTATGRYAKVMEPILWEILNCVFVDFPLYDKQLRGDEPLRALYGMTTYFDKHREQTESYDDIFNELEMVQQGLKMSEIVKKFQTVKMVFHAGNFFHRDCSFFLWKGELRRSKKRKRTALRRALLYRWKVWRAYARRYKAEELEGMDDELDRKLEALSKLQLLLQEHGSVKPSNTTTASPGVGDFAQAVGDALQDTLGSPYTGSSTVTSPAFSPIPSAPQSPGRTSKAAQFMKDRSSPLPVLSRVPTTSSMPMSAREKRKAQDQKLSSRRNMLEQVDLSIRSTLSSLTLQQQTTSGEKYPLVNTEIQGVHKTDATAEAVVTEGSVITEGEATGAAVSAKPSQITVDLIKEAALIASSLLCPSREQSTQTPDAWMTNVNEQPFNNPAIAVLGRSNSIRPGLSRQSSGVRPLMGSPTITQGKSLAVGGGAQEGGRVDIGGFHPPPFKLETLAACQLVTYIYEAKLRDALEDHYEINFSECLPLLEYSKELMLQRYGLKRLADKFFKGLIACVIKEGIINRRLETYARICGITLDGHKEGYNNYSESQISFYFHAIGVIFGQNLQLLTQCMNSFEIDREIILEVLPDLFPHIEKHNEQLAKSIMFEVVDLPRNTPGNELEYKVNFDDLMGLLLDYFEEEHKLDPEDSFLYEPLVQPLPDSPQSPVRPPSQGESLKALSTLTDFARPKAIGAAATTPKKIRTLVPSQNLV